MDPAVKLEVAALSRQQALRAAIAGGDSDVQRFYCGRTVFVTGGSGFLGKQLIEKLMRSCKLTKIYLLLRSKKGKAIQERLDAILEEPVFDSLRQQQPDFTSKIMPVEGDVAEINLGLSDEDWNTLTNEVDIIFHVAAVTKFDECLRVATLINVRGTRECLKLGRACKKLRSYVHVSTAYSHTTRPVLEGNERVDEVFYKSPIPCDTMISMAENMEDDRLKGITNDLIKDWPNTYSFTKAISEHMVQTHSGGLPICIVRPGVVLCAYNEPSPGWLDMSCVYGSTGLVIGLGMGLIHVIMLNTKAALGMVPCDYVNNTIIVAAKEMAQKQTKGGEETKIYTVTSVCRNPIKWQALHDVLETRGRDFPSPVALYYNFGFETSNRLVFLIFSYLWHIIPAYFVDFICLLIGKERRYAKIAKKVYNMSTMLSYFLLNEFRFDDRNTETLYETLSKTDKIIFNFDITSVNWEEFMLMWIIGCRKYIVKDGLKDTVAAIRKQKYFRILHYVLMTLYVYGIWKLLSFVFCTGVSLF